MADVPELHLAGARERKHAKEPEALEALTAFLVVITPQGAVMVVPEIPDEVKSDHTATEAEIETACNSIVENMKTMRHAQMTAQAVLQAMMQAGQQMQSQQVNKRLLDDINAGRARPPR